MDLGVIWQEESEFRIFNLMTPPGESTFGDDRQKNNYWRPFQKIGSPKYHRQKKTFFGDDSIFDRQKIKLLTMKKNGSKVNGSKVKRIESETDRK